MYMLRTFAHITALISILLMASRGWSAVAHDVPPVAPPSLPPAVEAAEPEPEVVVPETGCRLKGVVVCSEYGARQKEDLVLILVDERGYRHDALIYKDDGTFYTRIPCSGNYTMRIELGDGAIELGEITLPPADTNSTYELRIVHPGSMLELILEARTSSESDLTYRKPVVVPPGGY